MECKDTFFFAKSITFATNMAKEKRFCLIGRGIQGSLSPALMRAAYGGRYGYDLVDEDSFEAAWQRAMDYDGFNVTAPYKFKAFSMCLAHDSNSLTAEAANLIVPIPGGGFRSFNTDIDGVAEALVQGGVARLAPEPRPALVVGTGGAASAAISALTSHLHCLPIVAGRDVEKARRMCLPDSDGSEEPVPGRHFTGLSPLVLDKTGGDIGIIVYTLPGSAPVPDGLPLENAVVLEAEYKNPRLADAGCRRYVSGKLWLMYQAVAGFRILTGEEPCIAAMREVLGL